VEAVNLFRSSSSAWGMTSIYVGLPPAPSRSSAAGKSRARPDQLLLSIRELASAGVPVMEGLADLRESVENPRFREVVSG